MNSDKGESFMQHVTPLIPPDDGHLERRYGLAVQEVNKAARMLGLRVKIVTTKLPDARERAILRVEEWLRVGFTTKPLSLRGIATAVVDGLGLQLPELPNQIRHGAGSAAPTASGAVHVEPHGSKHERSFSPEWLQENERSKA